MRTSKPKEPILRDVQIRAMDWKSDPDLHQNIKTCPSERGNVTMEPIFDSHRKEHNLPNSSEVALASDQTTDVKGIKPETVPENFPQRFEVYGETDTDHDTSPATETVWKRANPSSFNSVVRKIFDVMT